MSHAPFLLDTCAIIFISRGESMRAGSADTLAEAANEGRIRVSPISAWEIGLATAKGRLKLPYAPLDFFQRFVHLMSAELSLLSPEILVESSYLPGSPHKDPTDRVLMASARKQDMILVTRDQPILDYGRAGHLRTMAC
jgi:PIN domain nuclease of toxin-antitoxin system